MAKSLSALERAKVAARHGVYPNAGWTSVMCWWCGGRGRLAWSRSGRQVAGWTTAQGMEFDHVVPLSLGGENTADNTVLACRSCNRSRCNRPEPRGCR